MLNMELAPEVVQGRMLRDQEKQGVDQQRPHGEAEESREEQDGTRVEGDIPQVEGETGGHGGMTGDRSHAEGNPPMSSCVCDCCGFWVLPACQSAAGRLAARRSETKRWLRRLIIYKGPTRFIRFRPTKSLVGHTRAANGA